MIGYLLYPLTAIGWFRYMGLGLNINKLLLTRGYCIASARDCIPLNVRYESLLIFFFSIKKKDLESLPQCRPPVVRVAVKVLNYIQINRNLIYFSIVSLSH